MTRLFFVLGLLFAGSVQGQAPQTLSQKVLFPTALKGIRIGMTEKAFARARDTTKMQHLRQEFASHYTEKISQDNIQEVRYVFDEERRLYEVVVRYAPDYNIHGLMAGMYGRPNKTNKHWQFKVGDNLSIRIYEQDHAIHLADARDF